MSASVKLYPDSCCNCVCMFQAFVTYLRSIFLMGNKQVFDVHAVDLEKYAA